MATTYCTAVNSVIAGIAVNSKSATTGGTIVVQKCYDFNKLSLRLTNDSTTASVILTIGAGDNYSAIGIGSTSLTLATATTYVMGPFDSARFKTDDDELIITVPTAGTVSVEANTVCSI
jgi:hypothetical protein